MTSDYFQRIAGFAIEHGAIQRQEELAAFAALIGTPRRVLEIGTFRGATLRLMMALMERHRDSQAMAVDIDTSHIDYAHIPPSHWTGRLKVHQGDSTDPETINVIEEWFDGPLDVLFLDGCHFTDVVRYEWEALSPLVRPGGLVAMHDILGHPNEVPPLWDELKEQYSTLEIIGGDMDQLDGSGGIGAVFIPEEDT